MIEDYQDKTGYSKKWIADQLDISTQWLFELFKKDNIDYITLAKLSVLLSCRIIDLMEIIVEKE
jgi:DNA-binding Xre family transcriptional regulator